jgi:hypothetical protein
MLFSVRHGARWFSQYLFHHPAFYFPHTIPLYDATLKEIVFLGFAALSQFLPSPCDADQYMNPTVPTTERRGADEQKYISVEQQI